MKWEVIRLGDAASFINGYPFKPTDWKTEGKEIIRIQNLTGSSSQVNYYDGKIPDKYLVKAGDILISWSATLGVFEWDKEEAWLNQHIFKVVFDKFEFDKAFFKYLIASKIAEMERNVHGATMQHITKSRFESLQIPLPPLTEQRRIASILDRADALRRKDRALLEQYERLGKAVFWEMFGDPVKNEKGWEVKSLEEVCEKIQIGPFGTQLHVEDYISGGIPLINPMHIIDSKIKADENFSVSELKYNELVNYHLKAGDLIMARRGEMGRCAVVTEAEDGWLCGTGSLFFRPKKNVDPKFLLFCMTSASMKALLENESMGVTMNNLNLRIVNELKIILPPFDLQVQFKNLLRNIAKQQEKLAIEFHSSTALFNSLLHRAFRGEL